MTESNAGQAGLRTYVDQRAMTESNAGQAGLRTYVDQRAMTESNAGQAGLRTNVDQAESYDRIKCRASRIEDECRPGREL